jgi:hypothetical protein
MEMPNVLREHLALTLAALGPVAPVHHVRQIARRPSRRRRLRRHRDRLDLLLVGVDLASAGVHHVPPGAELLAGAVADDAGALAAVLPEPLEQAAANRPIAAAPAALAIQYFIMVLPWSVPAD